MIRHIVMSILLGCFSLQGMEDATPADTSAPQTENERLLLAIKNNDLTKARQFLLRLKGKISAEGKESLEKVAQESLVSSSQEISLLKSRKDRNSFLLSVGAAAVALAGTYVFYKRCTKKYIAFKEIEDLKAAKDLIIARDVIGAHAATQAKPPAPETLEKYALEAVAKETFSGKNYYKCPHAVRQRLDAAKNRWHNAHSATYRPKKKDLQSTAEDCMLSFGGAFALGTICMKFCKAAFKAYTCPSATEKNKQAHEIKQRILLLDTSKDVA